MLHTVPSNKGKKVANFPVRDKRLNCDLLGFNITQEDFRF